MQAVSQSPFLQALGYAIAGSLWQAALLWLIVCAVNGVFKLTSRQRYLIAFVAQLATFVWFVFTLQYYYNVCSEAADAMKVIMESNSYNIITSVQQQSNGFNIANVTTYIDKLLPYLSVAYLSLLIILLAKWVKSYLYINKIRTTGLSDIDNKWKLFVERMTIELNITDHVTIALSKFIKTPLTVGFIKPIILIPFASVMHLTTEQLEALILHELAHIRRADYILNLYQTIFEKVLFFNPFTQLIKRIIEKEREHSCDDWVMEFRYNPSMYAEALLKVAYMQTQPDLAMYAATKKSSDLLVRVKRILNQHEKTFNYKQQLGALILLTAIFGCVAFIKPAPVNHEKVVTASTKNILLKPVIEQVKNPLFNPASLFAKENTAVTDKKQKQEIIPDVSTPLSSPQISAPPPPPAAPDIVYGNAGSDMVNSNWQEDYQRSIEDAQKEIEKINLQPLSQNLKGLMDTAFLNKAIMFAIDKNKTQFNFKNINESLNKLGTFKAQAFKNFADKALVQQREALNMLHEKQGMQKLQAVQDKLKQQQLFSAQKLNQVKSLEKDNYDEEDNNNNDEALPASVPEPVTFSYNNNYNGRDDKDSYSDNTPGYSSVYSAPAVSYRGNNSKVLLRNNVKNNQVKTITITRQHSSKDKDYKIVIEIR